MTNAGTTTASQKLVTSSVTGLPGDGINASTGRAGQTIHVTTAAGVVKIKIRCYRPLRPSIKIARPSPAPQRNRNLIVVGTSGSDGPSLMDDYVWVAFRARRAAIRRPYPGGFFIRNSSFRHNTSIIRASRARSDRHYAEHHLPATRSPSSRPAGTAEYAP